MENLVEQLGSVAVVENSRPKFIIVTYNRFKDLVIHKSIDNSANFDKDGSEEIIDRLNKEILALKEQVAEKEKESPDNL